MTLRQCHALQLIWHACEIPIMSLKQAIAKSVRHRIIAAQGRLSVRPSMASTGARRRIHNSTSAKQKQLQQDGPIEFSTFN